MYTKLWHYWLTVGILFALIFGAQWGYARDGYQARPLVCDPNGEYKGRETDLAYCKAWISNVQTPNGKSRCCGEGDAYVADTLGVEDGETVVTITRDYPAFQIDDGEGDYFEVDAISKGTKIKVPVDRINPYRPEQANPTGHGIIFMDGNRNVLCYFTPTLS